MKEVTHRELCLIGAKWLRNKQREKYIIVEIELANCEQPDIFAFGSWYSKMIEVKVSRADFLSDKKKWFRQQPEKGVGQLRYYLCPKDLIRPEEIPTNWGLLYFDGKDIEPIVKAEIQQANPMAEMKIAASILRREGYYNKIFSYKKYKTD